MTTFSPISLPVPIRNAIQNRKTILVIGATGSGRTAMLYAIAEQAAAMFPAEHVAMLCDIEERASAEPANLKCYPGTREVTAAISEACAWLFVDELRGREAAGVLEAWCSGHYGGAAVHGRSIEQGINRLKSLVKGDETAALSFAKLVDSSIDVVIFMEYSEQGPSIADIQFKTAM
jgi:Flp pilus assembly CpaF family ATPase